MPEGPEIRRAADRLASVLRGRKVAAETFHPALDEYAPLIDGATIEDVTCRGKAMLTQLSTGITIYSHNQLYGVWKVNRRETTPRSNRSLRLAFFTDKHAVRLYSATDISVWPTTEVHQHPFIQSLGPDVLDSTLTVTDLTERLNDPRYRRRSTAALYLDQHFLAGIGNYLRSEILHVAGIHPDTRPAQLDGHGRRRLARASIAISQQSYETGGVTNKLSRSRRLRRGGATYEQSRFLVFNRDGEACYTCGDEIVKAERGSRRIYWCPTCQ